MDRKWYVSMVLLFVIAAAGCGSEQLSVVAPGAKVEKLAGG